MNTIPSFFTFFKAGRDNANLKIPKVFTECMDHPYPERVLLRDPNEHLWTVKVKKVGTNWCFVDGWVEFVNDNSMTSGELLMFAYIRKDIFDVKLYRRKCATEKIITRPFVDDDNDQEYERNQLVTRNANNGCGGGNKRAAALRLCYGMEIFGVELAEKPIIPYFVTQFKPKRRSSLFIPVDVIKDYGLTLDDKITLIDPEGREFESKCTQWCDGRVVVSGGGWAQLCRLNTVNEDDKCICEFVQTEGDQQQVLHINFVRSNL